MRTVARRPPEHVPAGGRDRQGEEGQPHLPFVAGHHQLDPGVRQPVLLVQQPQHQGKQGAIHDGHKYRWMRGLLEILKYSENAEDFLEHTKLEMYSDQVFCFTPKGLIVTLPQGATPIDFAYAVHSDVGNHCTGVKINGRIMPLRTVLENGDQVEIITSKNQEPSPQWERFVITGKARASIRRYIRQQKRHQFGDLG